MLKRTRLRLTILAAAATLLPLVAAIFNDPTQYYLRGIGYAQQEYEKPRGANFEGASRTPTGIGYASFAGGLNIYISGVGFNKDALNENIIILESQDLGGQKFESSTLS